MSGKATGLDDTPSATLETLFQLFVFRVCGRVETLRERCFS